jgi:serine/threonine-protein kinase
VRTPSRPEGQRCRLVEGCGPTPFDEELASLLRRRLRLVTLIILVPALFFFLRRLLGGTAVSAGPEALPLAGEVIIPAVLLVSAGLVWSRLRLPLCRLRTIEMLIFGTFAVLFSVLQYRVFTDPGLYTCAQAGGTDRVMPSLVKASTFRWFFLIVVYGVFIPNTWRRCALLVGGAATLALGMTALGAILAGQSGCPYLLAGLGEMAVLLSVGVTVAIFGSYRIQVLQREVYDAKQLGQYRLMHKLGAGGMGEVFMAEHTLLRRPCAVKVIHQEQAGDPTTLLRFEREVRAMATLTNWNTVEIYDYGHAQDGTFYYVMEYLPGMDLDTLVARHGTLPPERVVHLLRQVCGALHEAHGIGLLHRDIKPSNIFVCKRGGIHDVAKLLDFGLVQDLGINRFHDRLTMQGTIVGSPTFMSPEQAAGKPNLDGRSDIYSLGGVAYFLLTGQQPFVRETTMQTLLAHAHDPVVPPSQVRSDLPDDLDRVVLRCLEKDPARRFQDIESLDRALAGCRSSGSWTEEQAAAWWDSHPQAESAEQEPTAAVQVA